MATKYEKWKTIARNTINIVNISFVKNDKLRLLAKKVIF